MPIQTIPQPPKLPQSPQSPQPPHLSQPPPHPQLLDLYSFRHETAYNSI
jgi:hypothetical protein